MNIKYMYINFKTFTFLLARVRYIGVAFDISLISKVRQ